MNDARDVLCARCPVRGRGCRNQLLNLYDYWDGKRRGRAFPARADIDPLELGQMLPNLFLVDVLEAAPHFRYRLSGGNVDEIHGQSLTGKTPRHIRTADVAAAVEQRYREIVAARQPRCDHVTMLAEDHTFWHYECLLLPLSEDGERINMLLGGIYET
ncbi:PAS domain-containing protein [Ferrovibrio xuzhouensis]|uniref:PAS domain-containing protein n=1 Tax=Ferrovibrio xuzhouensis TaxID=1576914 RepID=A0ABV7VG57_9PROT